MGPLCRQYPLAMLAFIGNIDFISEPNSVYIQMISLQ